MGAGGEPPPPLHKTTLTTCLYHSVILLNFATSCLHNADVALSRGGLDAHFMNPYTECYSYAECTNAEG